MEETPADVKKNSRSRYQYQYRFPCNICGKLFKFRSALKYHNRIHDRVDQGTVTHPHPCTVCSATFQYPSLLKMHIKKHAPKAVQATPDIDVKMEETPAAVKKNSRSRYHYQNRFPCNICGKLFKFRSALKYHNRIHNRVDQRTVTRHHSCTVCSATFQYPSLLKMHIEKHGPKEIEATPSNRIERCTDDESRHPDSSISRKFICSHCERSFGSQATLDAHLRTHTGERPYQCRIDGCVKRFAQTSTRSYHERTHSNAAPHICADCGRGFKHGPNLARHARVHTGLRPYPCSECNMAFKSLGRLKDHTRRHTGELPYICSQCPSKFRCVSQLRRHENSLHSRNKLWHCSVCGKVFTQPGNLRTHMRTHTGEKPYACHLCDMRFSHSGSLKGHVKTHAFVKNGKH